MVKQFLHYMKGCVRIRVSGSSYERFLNMCVNHNIILSGLQAVDGAYEMNISISGFRELRPLVKKSGTRVCIIRRYGLPFFLHYHRKRKMLFGGVVFGVFLMMFLTAFVWDIHIEGNQTRTDEVIFDFLREQKIGHGILKSQVDCKELAAEFRKEFDNFIWVSVKIEGTRLLIDVQENTDLVITENIDEGPSDLVANVNGVVTSIITRSGAPQVKAGDTVKKGDLLVKGELEITDDAGEIANRQYCAADADIYIQSVYNYEYIFPFAYQEKAYTGQVKNSYFLKLANKTLGFRRSALPFAEYDSVMEEKQLKVGSNLYLPISFGKTVDREYRMVTKNYTENQAITHAETVLDKFIEKIQEKGVQIFENNVKIEMSGEKCKSAGKIIVIQKAGKRVERNITENEHYRDDDIDTDGT